MPGRIDLHIHTCYSDGLSSPKEIVEIVRRKRLCAFSICDHDTLHGYWETKKILIEGDPELVPGVELSVGRDFEDIHILGYYFNPESSPLSEALEDFRGRRNRRGQEMLSRLKKVGIDITLEAVKKIAGESAIGRPHIADAMLKAGAIKNYETAFIRYIGHDCPAYVPKENLTPVEAFNLIHKAGGLAFLAHPGIGNVAAHINEFLELGLDGIEIYHPRHGSRLRREFSNIVINHAILGSGGSDYHGREGRYSMIGSQSVPDEYLTALKGRLKR
ncbi:MAG: PHP domain-containing protein [candidate division Zixibacteria bacterium]|nr:PHP domain-containing protein [candidate division Zixibacteria bacterium]